MLISSGGDVEDKDPAAVSVPQHLASSTVPSCSSPPMLTHTPPPGGERGVSTGA